MRILTILIAMAISTVSAFGQTWITNPANGHLYTTVDSTDWEVAESMAVGLGGHLVTINDQAENDWMWSWLLTSTSLPVERAWIGLYQIPGSPEPAGGWAWVSGEPVVYTHWHPGEPNNALGIEEKGEFWIRTHVAWEQPSFWNDTWSVHPDITIGIVEAVPEPATMAVFGLGLLAFIKRRRK